LTGSFSLAYNCAVDNIDLISLKDVQKMLQISKATLWNWIQQGRITTVRLSPRKIYVRREELERFVKEAERPVKITRKKK